MFEAYKKDHKDSLCTIGIINMFTEEDEVGIDDIMPIVPIPHSNNTTVDQSVPVWSKDIMI